MAPINNIYLHKKFDLKFMYTHKKFGLCVVKDKRDEFTAKCAQQQKKNIMKVPKTEMQQAVITRPRQRNMSKLCFLALKQEFLDFMDSSFEDNSTMTRKITNPALYSTMKRGKNGAATPPSSKNISIPPTKDLKTPPE